MKYQIKQYIEENYDYNTPVLTSEIREEFPDIKAGTVRQILRRLKKEEFLEQSGPGTFFKPKETGVLKRAYITMEQVVKKRYLYDDSKIVGYVTGVNLANELSLTSQTSFVMELVSNKVADKKRKINISNRTITIQAPRTLVNNNNYRLLQVLDILTSFEKYSEIDIFEARPKLLNYLSEIKLTDYDIEKIITKYPIKTQLNYYKLLSGGNL
jgi:hypothetical protein